MKGEASVGTCFIEAFSIIRRLAAVVVVGHVVFWSSATTAKEGLGFHGTLVHSGCLVVPVSAIRSDDQSSRYFEVSGMTLEMNTWRNACADKAIPVAMQYQSLPSSSFSLTPQNQNKSQTGVLTLTYQ